MSPQEVIAFLNEYLSEMTGAIREWVAISITLSAMPLWPCLARRVDQPNREWAAVAAALAMRERLVELNRRRAARGEAPIDNGIGISAGEAVAGQIGSLERLMYTVIGDTVNVAARLER